MSDEEGPERIAKRLARAGVASRRVAETMIEAGRVAVNGKIIDSPALNVTARDRITVDGQPVAEAEPTRLWRYHKPAGLVTSERDEQGRDTVFDKLPEDMPRVLSIGRLDISSEGLLLLTNDGALKRRLELPATGWLRKYRVRAHGETDDSLLEPLRRGITVDGETFQPMRVDLDRKQGSNVWLTIAIREGRNREVRRALQAVGLVVNRLIRTAYGPFQLGELAAGAVEEVRPKILREQLGVVTQRPVGANPVSETPKPAGKAAGAGKAGARRPVGAGPSGKNTSGKNASGKTPSVASEPRPAGGKPAGRPTVPRSGAPRSGAPRPAGDKPGPRRR